MKILKKFIALFVVAMAVYSSSGLSDSSIDAAPKVGVQLWSVKESVKSDIKGTLNKLSEMGFDGVEFAGEFGEFSGKPEELRNYMESLGLEVSSAHVSFDDFDEENAKDNIAFYQTLGVDTFIIPLDQRSWNSDTVDDFVQDIRALSNRLRPHGFKIGYHNHQFEFDSYRDGTYWSYLVESTPKDIFFQLDIAWAQFADQSPADLMKRHADRIPTSHFKPQILTQEEWSSIYSPEEGDEWMVEMRNIFSYSQELVEKDEDYVPVIGEDLIEWDLLVDTVLSQGNLDWIVIEQEIYPAGLTPLEAVAQSKRGLDEILSHNSRK